jgi:RNA polymerase sigma-70 factor (ECF subfamily)
LGPTHSETVLTGRNDKTLVEATVRGDREAYAALVRRYASRVYAVCLSMLSDPDDSQDLAQDTLIKGMERIHTLRDGSQFATWITRIAQNQCRDHWRVKKRRDELMRERGPELLPGSGEETMDLPLALERLPEKHRTPLMLYYFDGQSSQNVAAALSTSRSGASRRLAQAREALRRLLESSHD